MSPRWLTLYGANPLARKAGALAALAGAVAAQIYVANIPLLISLSDLKYETVTVKRGLRQELEIRGARFDERLLYYPGEDTAIPEATFERARPTGGTWESLSSRLRDRFPSHPTR